MNITLLEVDAYISNSIFISSLLLKINNDIFNTLN
jgi:hypothetical protein